MAAAPLIRAGWQEGFPFGMVHSVRPSRTTVTMFVKVTMSTGTLPTSSSSSFSTWSSRSSNSRTPISPLVSSNLGTRSSTRSTNRDEMDLTLKKKSEEEEEKIVPDTKLDDTLALE